MASCRLILTWLYLLLGAVYADIYLHVPRGSNNRLNERRATRQTNNRMFDSQNNNRGGYNVGDLTDRQSGSSVTKQYNMKYFQSDTAASGGESMLNIEWTNQHSCGGNEQTDPHKQNCELVMQFMCQDEPTAEPLTQVRNGVSTSRISYQQLRSLTESQSGFSNRRNRSQTSRGMNESFEFYDKCFARERNAGLFTADQILKRKQNGNLGYSSAIFTRQNPNGSRNGLECPEERDYYPYWHPTPWRDIAVLTDKPEMCEFYQQNSFNQRQYGECVEEFSANLRRPYSRYNNAADCEANGKMWMEFYNYLEIDETATNQAACVAKGYNWGLPHDSSDISAAGRRCLVPVPQVDCGQAPWSRSNHFGNGRNGTANTYIWKLPNFPSNSEKQCAFRFRYNVSTDDYDPWTTDAVSNNDASPVRNNPEVFVEEGQRSLRLAINTAQFGRTFEDRSHVFMLKPRPATMAPGVNIQNLNVRGKRGNIVQVYPAVEYDFAPSQLVMGENDLVHVQWTGSNSHNNQSPGGDGQTGDDGEGTRGTDRTNIVQINDMNDNYPIPYERSTMWASSTIIWDSRSMVAPSTGEQSRKDLALFMATSGYNQCFLAANCGATSLESKRNLNNLLNNAPASFEGVVLKMSKGTYMYMGSRNNNFSNRSQKASIIVA